MTKKKTLKLYVWEGVLTDWTSGIMFALASSPDEARKEIRKSYGRPVENVFPELAQEPQVFSKPVGFHLYGGG